MFTLTQGFLYEATKWWVLKQLWEQDAEHYVVSGQQFAKWLCFSLPTIPPSWLEPIAFNDTDFCLLLLIPADFNCVCSKPVYFSVSSPIIIGSVWLKINGWKCCNARLPSSQMQYTAAVTAQPLLLENHHPTVVGEKKNSQMKCKLLVMLDKRKIDKFLSSAEPQCYILNALNGQNQ